jgi:hypothetical protein
VQVFDRVARRMGNSGAGFHKEAVTVSLRHRLSGLRLNSRILLKTRRLLFLPGVALWPIISASSGPKGAVRLHAKRRCRAPSYTELGDRPVVMAFDLDPEQTIAEAQGPAGTGNGSGRHSACHPN